MAKLYFSDLKKAQRVAKKRGKRVYRMYENKYFVGTYEQAIKRWKKVKFTKNIIK